MLSEDVVCEEELADQVLTQIGSLSLFVEIDMDTHHEQETDKPRRCLENGIGQVRVVFLVVLAVKCKLQPLLLREMQCGIMKLWDPGISQAQTIFFYPRSFLSGGDWLVLDRLPPADRNSSHGKEGLERVHSVLDKLSSWSYDSFHLWGRNAFRTRSDKHLNIMDVSNGDLLLHRHEEWSHIHADQIIKAAKCGHTLQHLACFREYVCSTYCLQFNPCQISAVKAHIAFKVRLRSWLAIKVATPCSYLLMHQIAYMGQVFFGFCFSSTWPPYRYIDEVAVSSIDSSKARGCNSGFLLYQLMKDALPIGHTYVWGNIRSRILATEVSF
jgi:hypothetical protein